MDLARLAKIVPILWPVNEADDATAFYMSLFPDSKIDRGRRPRARAALDGMMSDPDTANAKRTAEAAMSMIKFDIAALKNGRAGA